MAYTHMYRCYKLWLEYGFLWKVLYIWSVVLLTDQPKGY